MSRNISRIRPTPPEPTLENPFAQLDWVWHRYLRRYTNANTRTNSLRILSDYKRFLREENGYDERLAGNPKFYLSVHWDYFALYNTGKYWQSRGHASHTILNKVKVLRRVMNFAAGENLTSVPFFIDPNIRVGERETSQREAYSEEELTFIRGVITPSIMYAKAIVTGYRRTGAGRDPRGARGWNNLTGSPRAKLATDIHPTLGWGAWDNMVWYFENILNCRPILATRSARSKHDRFYRAAHEHHGGISEVWRKLGVTPLIDCNLVVPLAMKLAWETGLNPDSIYNLKRDCFQESHPLTGLPYLRYYKERSSGEKDLHLSLFDVPNPSELHLLPKQSEIIKHTVTLISNLTRPLVTTAKERDKDLLLLMQVASAGNGHGSSIGDVKRLDTQTIYQWTSQFKRLPQGRAGSLPSSFNLARFRPTKITQMVRAGLDFFHIQAVAGHAEPKTTLKYLSTYQLADQERREVSAALVRIHQNRTELDQEPKPYATGTSLHKDGVIYKGIICDCKNVFDPPDTVRRLPVYQEGQACTYWNMCLLCPNVLVTSRHLPLLVAYHREIEAAIEGNNLGHAPNALLYQKIKAVLEGIFLDFGEEAIARAREVAESGDEYIDTVTSRVVYNG